MVVIGDFLNPVIVPMMVDFGVAALLIGEILVVKADIVAVDFVVATVGAAVMAFELVVVISKVIKILKAVEDVFLESLVVVVGAEVLNIGEVVTVDGEVIVAV